MNNDFAPYSSMILTMRATNQDEDLNSRRSSPMFSSLASGQSSLCRNSQLEDLGGHETKLLEMVRASRDNQELDQPLQLPRDDVSDDYDITSEACVHGLSMRNTERSISRSRVSRMSTRRDMDIPSILAFTTNTPKPAHLEIPEFQKVKDLNKEEVPRWSIRRSVCPVCSQKWRDRSSIKNVKYSGLKRNFLSELPSVIAPARLRTSITLGYVPRPALAAVDEDTGVTNGVFRNTSATWQLTRARRFRAPKPQVPPPEANAPPSATAPLARKDLDTRVNRFLYEEKV